MLNLLISSIPYIECNESTKWRRRSRSQTKRSWKNRKNCIWDGICPFLSCPALPLVFSHPENFPIIQSKGKHPSTSGTSQRSSSIQLIAMRFYLTNRCGFWLDGTLENSSTNKFGGGGLLLLLFFAFFPHWFSSLASLCLLSSLLPYPPPSTPFIHPRSPIQFHTSFPSFHSTHSCFLRPLFSHSFFLSFHSSCCACCVCCATTPAKMELLIGQTNNWHLRNGITSNKKETHSLTHHQ